MVFEQENRVVLLLLEHLYMLHLQYLVRTPHPPRVAPGGYRAAREGTEIDDIQQKKLNFFVDFSQKSCLSLQFTVKMRFHIVIT